MAPANLSVAVIERESSALSHFLNRTEMALRLNFSGERGDFSGEQRRIFS
jgi:hypothetical protein